MEYLKMIKEAKRIKDKKNIEDLAIEEQGMESDELFFNIANCYYKMNKVAPAIYYYEKALLISSVCSRFVCL